MLTAPFDLPHQHPTVREPVPRSSLAGNPPDPRTGPFSCSPAASEFSNILLDSAAQLPPPFGPCAHLRTVMNSIDNPRPSHADLELERLGSFHLTVCGDLLPTAGCHLPMHRSLAFICVARPISACGTIVFARGGPWAQSRLRCGHDTQYKERAKHT